MAADHQPARKRRKTRVTITDVAAIAKVSVASVSRFINAPESVSLEMGAQISEALRQSGFRMRRNRPEPIAGGAIACPRLVAFLTLGKNTIKDLMAMPIYPQLFAGVTRALQVGGGNLVYTHYAGSGPLPAPLLDGSCDAILVCGYLEPMPEALLAILNRTPSAWVMRQHSDPHCRIDHVFYDNTQVGRLAADYLLGRGARTLAVINAMTDHAAYAQRTVTFLDICRQAGATAEAFNGGEGGGSNLRAAVQAAIRGRTRPDGIFVPSDEQLLEVLHLLQEEGIEPEKQVVLIGCNNDPMLTVRMHPRPATVDIHLELLGERAVQQLAFRLANPAMPPMQVFVNPTVVPPER